jgi:hypothetical protein
MADRPTSIKSKDTEETIIDPLSSASTTNEYNVTLTNANTEYSQLLPSNTRKLIFQSRTNVVVRWAWTTGKVATPTAPYFTLKAGSAYFEDELKLSSKTLYLASSTAGTVVEIICYT